MEIKRYIQFINEGDETLGTRVEALYDKDDYIKNIVNRFIGDITPDIRLANAINILDSFKKAEIKDLIDKYEAQGIIDKKPIVRFSTEVEPVSESEIVPGGRGSFTSFLKVMTALGQKELSCNFDVCPNEFILYYKTTPIDTTILKSVIIRYRSLSRFVDDVDYTSNETSLYYGVRTDGFLEYGSFSDAESKFGDFKLNQSALRWLTGLELQAARAIKKDIVNLTYKDILTLGSIKLDMSEFSPGYCEENLPVTLSDRILSFGYKGVGKWDNGKLDQGEIENIKSKLITWIMSKKWSGSVLISVKASSYWVYVHIKLK